MMRERPAIDRAIRSAIRAVDPRLEHEMDSERIVFDHLKELGWLEGLEGGRILEIGPKHGEDTTRLVGLKPAEIVLLDLPEKTDTVFQWLSDIEAKCPTRFVFHDIVRLTPADHKDLGRFDLVWCTGVIYHTAEQLRMMRVLFDLCAEGGRVVVESEVPASRAHREAPVVEIHWPETLYGVETVTHLPSADAMRIWAEMVGFRDVESLDAYSRFMRRRRATIVGHRTPESTPYAPFGREYVGSEPTEPAS